MPSAAPRPTSPYPVDQRSAGGEASLLAPHSPGQRLGGGASFTSDLAVCLWIPLFALRAEELRRPELVLKPTALLAPDDPRRLWQISPRARHAGVRPGMTVSQAIGFCPSLALCEPDPVYYDEQFARILMQLGHVSPVIEPAELGKVFVGMDGLDRLYGGPERQLEAIARAISKCGKAPSRTAHSPARRAAEPSAREHRAGSGERAWYRRAPIPPYHPAELGWVEWARLGWARGKFVSWVAATKAKFSEAVLISDHERAEFLRAQSVAVLPLDHDTRHRLWQLDVKTLGELARLPEEALVAQFGSSGRRAWRLAAGAIHDPVIGRERPEPIVAALDYLTPVADRGMLAHGLELLIDRALKHPRRVGWRVHVVRARASLEQGASWMAEVILKDPAATRERIAAPLNARLEQTPPVGAVERLAVEFLAFTLGTDELQLFARDAQSSARTGRRRALDSAAHEIKMRLKRSMLYHVIEVHPWSRIPERRYALIDFEP